jgi:hypothetical protein
VKFRKLKKKTKILTWEKDFWRRSARTSTRENVRNEIIRKMDVKNYNS